jgi:uncharacterized protein YjiS (DUF1127 family)
MGDGVSIKTNNGCWLKTVFRLLAKWDARYMQRIALSELDSRLLEDTGIDWDDRRRECSKWFWQR